VRVRARRDADLGACVQLATAVHELDGSPPRMAEDLTAFIASIDAVGAWVAEEDGSIAGHVALLRSSSDDVMRVAQHATGRTRDGLAVVARLLVSPHARRLGLGRSLLATAVTATHGRGWWPVLDVATHFTSAMKLYETCGWQRIGQVTTRFPAEDPLDEYVYIGQPPPHDRVASLPVRSRGAPATEAEGPRGGS